MLKYFIIFFFCILYLDAFTQVVIKEEVILYPEEVGDTLYDTPSMPFYGRVRVERLCNYIWWWGNPKFKATVGNQTYTTPCYNCPPQCGVCQTGSFIFVFNDVPLGTAINLEEQICGSGGIMPLRLILLSENRYRIQGNTSGNTWNNFGAIRFIATTPPDCDNVEICSLSYIPPTLLINEPQGYSNYLNNPPCIDINGNPRLAYSVPPTKNIATFNISYSCFDLQKQKWEFVLDNSDNALKLNWVVDFCLENFDPETTLLDDLEYLNDPYYTCSALIHDLKLMKTKETWPSYMFKSLIRKHELGHLYIFEEIYKEKISSFNIKYRENINYSCNEFPGINQVEEDIYNTFKEYYTIIAFKWRDKHINTPDIENLIDEVHLFPVIDDLISDINDNPQNYNCTP